MIGYAFMHMPRSKVVTTYFCPTSLANQPKKFEDHIIMIGTFHVVCTNFKMIGKKMEGTGFSDILLEAGLISSNKPSVPDISVFSTS
jgi:hypothetical protein